MEETRKYNGWSNRPTWLTSLWLTNDCQSYHYWRQATREVWEESQTSKQVTEWGWSRSEATRAIFAQKLRDETTEQVMPDEANLIADLLQYALDEVEWSEIADEYLEEFFEQFDNVAALKCARGEMEP